MPAEAVLDVVVVLDDQRLALARPGDQRGAALCRHDHPGRVVMRRVITTASTSAAAILMTRPPESTLTGTASRPEMPTGQLLPAPARILDRDATRAAVTQNVPEHGQRLGRRAADHYVLGLHGYPAHPGQVAATAFLSSGTPRWAA